jgi:hypothetical protein
MLKSCNSIKQAAVYEHIISKMDRKINRKTLANVRNPVRDTLSIIQMSQMLTYCHKIDIAIDPRFNNSIG